MSSAEANAADRVHVVRRLWKGWKRIAHTIGDVQARVLLTLFYFVIVAPFALALRLFADPLSLKPKTAKGWRLRRPASRALDHARRQF